MAKRRVLIVDDSKTAQVRLRKMLERFDLDVDTVLSAEEALGYLSYRQPAVIFLDHHMEGMDGLEALKIIKSNPSTALIPVIMYTSEKGDVYVGQARALGAIDILGKEVIKQSSLDKVLSSLGITSNSASANGTAPAADVQERDIPTLDAYAKTDSEPVSAFNAASENLDQVQRQISRLFEIHIAKVRQEIEDSTKFLLRRLAKEAQDKNKVSNRAQPVATPPGGDAPPLDSDFIAEPEPERSGGISAIFLGLILVSIAFLGYHLYINNRHQEILSEQYGQMIARTSAQEELMGRLFSKLNERSEEKSNASAYADRQVLLDALGWAVNVNTQVAFGDKALNDQRIYMVGELLSLLKAANFSGIIFLDVHLGNYCVVEDPSGGWILPEPESNLEDCVFLADRQPDVSVDEQVSVGFLNYLNSAPIVNEGSIEVELASQGYFAPRFSYPPVTSGVSAGEWNAAAQKNNRIAVSFSAN